VFARIISQRLDSQNMNKSEIPGTLLMMVELIFSPRLRPTHFQANVALGFSPAPADLKVIATGKQIFQTQRCAGL